MPNQILWTEEEIALLRLHWDKMSCRELGKLVNRSKNSVIGKAHRIGLPAIDKPHINTPPKPPRVRKSRKKSSSEVVTAMVPFRKKVPTGPTFYAPDRPLSGMPPIGIMELTVDSCRSIVGHGSNGLAVYCGDQTFPGKSFCPTHCALYYRPADERRRA